MGAEVRFSPADAVPAAPADLTSLFGMESITLSPGSQQQNQNIVFFIFSTISRKNGSLTLLHFSKTSRSVYPLIN